MEARQSAELSLTLPGKVLNMSALIHQKKFRNTGNKTGALKGWEMLQSDGIGRIHEQKAIRGTDKVHACMHVTVLQETEFEPVLKMNQMIIKHYWVR